MVNLSHVAEFYRDASRRENIAGVTAADLKIIHEFYEKSFQFRHATKFDKVNSTINSSLQELDSYLKSDSKSAIMNKSYKDLHTSVENVANN